MSVAAWALRPMPQRLDLVDTQIMVKCRRRRGARLTTLCSAVVVVALFALSAGAQATQAPVRQLTVPQALQAFNAIWPKFDSAFAKGQLDELAKYGTPDILKTAGGSVGCGCSWTTPHSSVKFSVPVQSQYPLSFLAQISTPAPTDSEYSPFVTLVVLTKVQARGQWRVSYMIRYSGDSTYLKTSAVEAAPPIEFNINVVGSQLADFFTAMVTSGSPPPNDDWPPTGSTGQELQDYVDTKAGVEASGAIQQTTFTALDNSPAFAFPDGDLMCGTYESQSNVTSATASPLVQPADQITWGGGLAPGTYSSITKFGLHDFCFIVNSRTNVVNPISFFGGVYETTGISVS